MTDPVALPPATTFVTMPDSGPVTPQLRSVNPILAPHYQREPHPRPCCFPVG